MRVLLLFFFFLLVVVVAMRSTGVACGTIHIYGVLAWSYVCFIVFGFCFSSCKQSSMILLAFRINCFSILRECTIFFTYIHIKCLSIMHIRNDSHHIIVISIQFIYLFGSVFFCLKKNELIDTFHIKCMEYILTFIFILSISVSLSLSVFASAIHKSSKASDNFEINFTSREISSLWQRRNKQTKNNNIWTELNSTELKARTQREHVKNSR